LSETKVVVQGCIIITLKTKKCSGTLFLCRKTVNAVCISIRKLSVYNLTSNFCSPSRDSIILLKGIFLWFVYKTMEQERVKKTKFFSVLFGTGLTPHLPIRLYRQSSACYTERGKTKREGSEVAIVAVLADEEMGGKEYVYCNQTHR
jgi:hypothetical protein